MVNFGLVEDFDTERFQCDCGVVWRLYPHAFRPHASTVGHRHPPADLWKEQDNGLIMAQAYAWVCVCKRDLLVTVPTFDTVECDRCQIVKMRQNPPADFYVNPRYGQACDCCGRTGIHKIRRGSNELPACKRQALVTA